MAQAQLYLANTNACRLVGLRDAQHESYQNNVTGITGSVRNADGTALTPAVILTFTYETNTDGNYVAPIDSTAAITAERTYLIRVDANAGLNMVGQWDFEVIAKTRRSESA